MFRLPLARLWDLLFLIPFLLPPYIAALSWTMALQPRGFLQQLAGWHLGPLLFSPAGVALVMGLAIFPVVYFAVSRSMAASGSRLAEAARVFGAGRGAPSSASRCRCRCRPSAPACCWPSRWPSRNTACRRRWARSPASAC